MKGFRIRGIRFPVAVICDQQCRYRCSCATLVTTETQIQQGLLRLWEVDLNLFPARAGPTVPSFRVALTVKLPDDDEARRRRWLRVTHTGKLDKHPLTSVPSGGVSSNAAVQSIRALVDPPIFS